MRFATFAAVFAALLLWPLPQASAQDRGQDRSPGFLDNLFTRGEQPAQPARRGAVAQADPSDPAELTVRLDRLENARAKVRRNPTGRAQGARNGDGAHSDGAGYVAQRHPAFVPARLSAPQALSLTRNVRLVAPCAAIKACRELPPLHISI